jgi:hypothetical protein
MKKIICLILYVWDVEDVDEWSRYVAGYIEFMRVLPHVFPGYHVHLTLGKDTLKLVKGTRWHDPLKEAIAKANHVKELKINRRTRSGKENRAMAPLVHRYDPILELKGYDTMLFRDVDSPPTPADAAAVKVCETKCNVMTVTLPLYGTVICGGTLSLFDMKKIAPRLKDMHMRKAKHLSSEDLWGSDEMFIKDCLAAHGLWDDHVVFECFYSGKTKSYHANPDFTVPVIDRLDERCEEECHWQMINAPCRAEQEVKIGYRERTIGPLPAMHGIMDWTNRRVFVVHAQESLEYAPTYATEFVHPGIGKAQGVHGPEQYAAKSCMI